MMKNTKTDYIIEIYKKPSGSEKMNYRFKNVAIKAKVQDWIIDGFELIETYPLFIKMNGDTETFITFEELEKSKLISDASWGNGSDLLNLVKGGEDIFDLYESYPIIDKENNLAWVSVIDNKGILEISK